MANPVLTGFEGRVAIITGAGRMRSIGRSIAVALGQAGCHVALVGTGRDPSTFSPDEQTAGWGDINSVAEEISSYGVKAIAYVADVSDEDSVSDLYSQIRRELGVPSILVNNAAAARGNDRVPVIDLEVEEWDKVQRVNLRGTFLMSREFSQHAVNEHQDGAIVNVSSIGGKLSGANTAAYSASKAAIQSLTSSMAKELGPKNIRVNTICPGVIDTERLSDRSGAAWDEYIRTNIPLQRIGTGEDVSNAALFLLSNQASWVSGQSWNIDGGQLTIR